MKSECAFLIFFILMDVAIYEPLTIECGTTRHSGDPHLPGFNFLNAVTSRFNAHIKDVSMANKKLNVV